MTRKEFEIKYAMKYWGGDFTHNPTETLQSMESNRRDGGYADHHIDLCWKVQQAKNMKSTAQSLSDFDDADHFTYGIEW